MEEKEGNLYYGDSEREKLLYSNERGKRVFLSSEEEERVEGVSTGGLILKGINFRRER